MSQRELVARLSARFAGEATAREAAYDAGVSFHDGSARRDWATVAQAAESQVGLDALERAVEGVAGKPLTRALAEHPLRLDGPVDVFAYHHADDAAPSVLRSALNAAARDDGRFVRKCRHRYLFDGPPRPEERAARALLAVVGPAFVASGFADDAGFADALARHAAGEAIVVPVVLRPCGWAAYFDARVALPRAARPVMLWPSWESAVDSVGEGLRVVLAKLRR